jgi:hypothetical protein
MQWNDETARRAREQAELDRARRIQKAKDNQFSSSQQSGGSQSGTCIIALMLFLYLLTHRWLVAD